MLKTFKRKDGKTPYYYISGTVRDGRKVVTINAESTGKIKKSEADKVCDARTKQILLSLEELNHLTFSECLDKMYKIQGKHNPSKRKSVFEKVRNTKPNEEEQKEYKLPNKPLGDYLLSDFTPHLISTFAYIRFPKLKKYEGKLLRDLDFKEKDIASPIFNTANTSYICVVSKVLHYGAKNGWCLDPTIEHFEVLNTINKKKRIFTVDEVNRCLAISNDEQIKLLLVFLIYTGCRISEALRMNWNNKCEVNNRPLIDLDNQELNIWCAKTQDWRLNVPIHNKLLEMLRKINHREDYLFEWKDQHEDQNNRRGIPHRGDGMLQMAGVPFKTRHDCRHTLATWLSDNGASTQELMRVIGWKSSKVALGYAGTTDNKRKDLIDNLPE